jgi:hypothetical protein
VEIGDWCGSLLGRDKKIKTYAKWNYIDIRDGEDRFLAFDVVGFDPEDHYVC